MVEETKIAFPPALKGGLETPLRTKKRDEAMYKLPPALPRLYGGLRRGTIDFIERVIHMQ